MLAINSRAPVKLSIENDERSQSVLALVPSGFEFRTEYAGLTLSPESAWFLPLESRADPEALGLRIGYAHFDSARERDFLHGTFIMLDDALGESVAAERIWHLEVCRLPEAPEAEGFMLVPELPAYLEWRDNREN